MTKKTLAHRAVNLIEKISSSDAPPSGSRPNAYFVEGGVGIEMNHSDVGHREELIGLLLGFDDWDTKFSVEYVRREVHKLIANALGESPVDPHKLVEIVIDRLESFSGSQFVIVPVEGLILEKELFDLGNVVFRQSTPAAIQDIVSRAAAIIRTSLGSPEELESQVELLCGNIKERIGGFPCYATYEVEAEPIRARERAAEEVDRALDLLRFATPYILPHRDLVGVGLPGSIARAFTTTLTFSSDGGLTSNPENRGSYIPFNLSSEVGKKLADIKILELSDLLRKKSPTDLERRILAGVRWCSRAQTQSQVEFRVLCLMTSLECILNSRQRPIRMGVSEGVALLIGAESLESRVDLRDFIRDMYDDRSAISHGGHPEISEQRVRRLCTISGQIIYRTLDLRSRFTTQKRLDIWLDESRLGLQADD